MKLFDTHCHFETGDAAEIAAQLRRAKAAGVEKLMAVGGSATLNESAALAAKLAAEAPSEFPVVLVAQGLDRDQATSQPSTFNLQPSTFNLQPLTFNFQPSTSLSAWGEIGLDYHYSPETREAQLKLFASQLEEAKRLDLPVVIHTREADDDTLAVLREVPSKGIIHCFTGSPGFAKKLLDLGFYVSISGIVTFKAAQNVREAALAVPDDRILIETDAPFLAPVPMRGNPNEPAFVKHTCDFLADLRGTDAAAFAELTFANAERVLGGEGRRS